MSNELESRLASIEQRLDELESIVLTIAQDVTPASLKTMGEMAKSIVLLNEAVRELQDVDDGDGWKRGGEPLD